MTQTQQRYKRSKSYVTTITGLGECEVRGASLKDGHLIVCTSDVLGKARYLQNMFVVDPSTPCGVCHAYNFRPYDPAVDGAE